MKARCTLHQSHVMDDARKKSRSGCNIEFELKHRRGSAGAMPEILWPMHGGLGCCGGLDSRLCGGIRRAPEPSIM
jgi:hypothetical protein